MEVIALTRRFRASDWRCSLWGLVLQRPRGGSGAVWAQRRSAGRLRVVLESCAGCGALPLSRGSAFRVLSGHVGLCVCVCVHGGAVSTFVGSSHPVIPSRAELGGAGSV